MCSGGPRFARLDDESFKGIHMIGSRWPEKLGVTKRPSCRKCHHRRRAGDETRCACPRLTCHRPCLRHVARRCKKTDEMRGLERMRPGIWPEGVGQEGCQLPMPWEHSSVFRMSS